MRVALRGRAIAAAAVAMLSLFAPRLAEAAGYVVTSTADSGAGTLRQAITSANASLR